MHSTVYIQTFISVAEDCPVKIAEVPKSKKEEKTIAELQYEMIHNNPYKYTSDDVIFTVFAIRSGTKKDKNESERAKFFGKSQPCLRSSPLVKRYGWGIHNNEAGKIAIYAMESKEYSKNIHDKSIKQLKGMKSKR